MAIDQYAQLYADAGKQYGVDPALLMAQGQAESSGNPDAVGPDTKYGNASGIAQLLPQTAKSLGVTDPTDPKQAIPAQAKLMAENMKRYGDPHTALLAYHGGTNTANWGDKTHAYASKVMDGYQQMAQNTAPSTTDPLEARAAEYNQNFLPGSDNSAPSSSSDAQDPLEARAKEHTPLKVTIPDLAALEAQKKKNIPVAQDVAETVPSSVAKGIGAIPQLPAMAGNAVANSMGYTYGKLAGASPEQQEKLNNINPFFTGNTPVDALTQAGKAIVNNNPGEANPVTGPLLHDPQTMPGRFANALTQGAVIGPAAGAKMIPSLLGATGAQTATEALPGNPVAPLIAGLATGAAPGMIKASNLRSTPENIASKVIQDSSKVDPNNIVSNQLVPGSNPTLAQITQDPNHALIERQLQQKNPAAFKELEDNNEAARQQHFEGSVGTPQDIDAMETAREAQRVSDTANIFKQGQKANAQPVVDKIDEILNGPGGKRDAVVSSLNNIRSKLVDDTGKLENDPETLYKSVQKQIADLLDKKDLSNSSGRQASRELLQVKEVLDKTIDQASPGFQKYLDNYSSASTKIDAARWLQGLKLTDVTGRFTLAKVKNALDNAKRLQNTPGIHEAKGVTPAQIDVLQNIHDDLLRRENVARASMPRGSNTNQNELMNNAMNSSLAGKANTLMGGNGHEIVGSAIGSTLGSALGLPGVGSFVGNMAGRGLKNNRAQKSAAATNRLQDFTLNPENYKQYLLDQTNNTYINRLMSATLKNP